VDRLPFLDSDSDLFYLSLGGVGSLVVVAAVLITFLVNAVIVVAIGGVLLIGLATAAGARSIATRIRRQGD
jgi:hypothetical protein